MLVIGCWLSVCGCRSPGSPVLVCCGASVALFWLKYARFQRFMIILSFLSKRVIFGPFCGCWLVVIGFWLSVIGCRFAVAGCRLVVIGCRSDRLQVSGPRFGPFLGCLLLPVGNVPASQELSKKGPFRALCAGSILVHAESWANVVYDPSAHFCEIFTE